MKSKKPTKDNDQKQSQTGEKNDLNKLIEKTKKQNEALKKMIEKINTQEK